MKPCSLMMVYSNTPHTAVQEKTRRGGCGRCGKDWGLQIGGTWVVVGWAYRLWDSNPHSFELDFESSASTNSAKPASSGGIKQGMEGIVKRDF